MSLEDLAFTPLHEQARLIARGDLSPVELAELYLDRISTFDPALNAFLTVTADRALALAQAAETAMAAGGRRGPLHGIPLALKDLFDVSGLATTGGSVVLQDNVADCDATVTRRLLEAGAVLLGKTQMVEFAFGGAGINHHHGTPWNPWDGSVHRLPGGSSSGSAVAVAAGLASVALGSDTGGSVRIPSSFCGLVGLKPTFGRVSCAGVLPLDPTLDSIGPLARCVTDAALVYNVIAGADPSDRDTLAAPAFLPADDVEGEINGMRLCIPREYFWADVEPEVEAAVRATAGVFAELGAHVDEVSLDELNRLGDLRSYKNLTAVETCASYGSLLEGRGADFDPIVRERMVDGFDVSAVEYLTARRFRDDLQRDTVTALADIDALLVPTTPFTAPAVDECDDGGPEYWRVNGMCLRNTAAANLLGLCSISLPCGFTREGLPVGLMLIGRPYEETRLLQLARAFEAATDWHQRRPELSD
ncbi:MAG TPA: amidase [Candidatus Latescibacteria bacterium]|jgi:aspartyl-tRNA(Asn)/glutamyl-tRNA(Gln) amidotransferase subunit A|nr:Asp-tRNA(Asn)/Glu-tRNA(Gln) amidotransferase GatCAB subunit A [Gemmatimonadaceae bacterium]MDP6015210.1 amidase [Candidatus Latescibacterota bacterium]HJP28936.1 amidase [Candidatus Latescibacterota bacterium]